VKYKLLMCQNVTIRPARAADASAIAVIMQSVWHDDTPDVPRISTVISQPDHATFVAEVDAAVVGFVDGFITTTYARRWEVDLLAVHPAHQRHGIARALIHACTTAGGERGAHYARALVGVSNLASEHVFAACGYSRVESIWTLCVGEPQPHEAAADGGYLITVRTLNYSGVWLEGRISAETMQTAQKLAAHSRLDLAGVLIPSNLPHLNDLLASTGYRRIGDYRWWHCVFSASPRQM